MRVQRLAPCTKDLSGLAFKRKGSYWSPTWSEARNFVEQVRGHLLDRDIVTMVNGEVLAPRGDWDALELVTVDL